MRTLRDRLLPAFLVVVLLITSGAMAAARGQARSASGEIVLCTGTGPVSVAVDARGKPLGKLHICPDCALGLFAVDAPAPLVPARALKRRTPRPTARRACACHPPPRPAGSARPSRSLIRPSTDQDPNGQNQESINVPHSAFRRGAGRRRFAGLSHARQ
jgi:hypothetical protein